MKKTLVFTLLFVALFYGNAQNTDYFDRMEDIFGNIDKAKVTTGFLKEFGVRFNDVEAFNGILDTTNFVDRIQWKSLYNSLYTMRVGSAAAAMATPSAFSNSVTTELNNTKQDVLLAAQYYTYQQYKANAVSNGDVIIINDRIYDVQGRNPYDTKTLFAVGALKNRLKGDTFSFKLPSALVYTNTSLTLSQIQVDFDNGQGYQTLTLNTVKNVTYTFGGEKELKIKFIYTNGPTLYSHTKIWVDYVDTGHGAQARFSGTAIVRDTITGAPYTGMSSSGYITVETAAVLGVTDSILDKPLIVIEGFDPDNEYNYFSFINSETFGGINIDIDQTGDIYTLNQAIEDEGYDLVFVDFENSTDFIQRNAYMVEEVIRWVNAQKAANNSTEKNVVMGMSMGGLVARYALRDMEINSEIHDTKLYISHDAPHQGANVPLAAQAFIRHLAGEDLSLPVFLSIFDVAVTNLEDAVDDFDDVLNGLDLLQSPAVKQMLIYQVQGTGQNISIDNNTMHNSFLTEYSNMGYPEQDSIRNIAISNGSECGTTLDFPPYSTLIDIDETIFLPGFSQLLLGIYNGFAINPLKALSTLFATSGDIEAKFKLKSLPNRQSKTIYESDIYIRKLILFAIEVHEPLIDEVNFNSSASMLPLENANGGIYDIENFSEFPEELEYAVKQQLFNFVPTYSSLDIGKGNQVITARDLNKVYSPLAPPIAPKDTPFDNFFTNELNSEQHIQFTLNNGKWLMAELSGTPELFSCSSSCVDQLPLGIVGENQVCSSEIYTLNNLANGVPVTWTIDSPGAFNLVANGNSVTVNSLGLVNGAVTLTATVDTDCNNIVKEKIIYAGSQRPMLLDNNGNEIAHIEACVNIHHGISFDTPPGAVEWEWNKVSGNFNLMANNNNYGTIFSYQPASGIISVRLRDDCGWSPPTFLTVNISNCASGNFQYMASPNPASNVLNISQTNQESSLNMSSESFALGESNNEVLSSATLFDFNGNPVQTISPAIGSMNVQSLSPGHYILVVTYGESSESHHILIE